MSKLFEAKGTQQEGSQSAYIKPGSELCIPAYNLLTDRGDFLKIQLDLSGPELTVRNDKMNVWEDPL